jgi:putative transposase
MARGKRPSAEQIIAMLRQIEVQLAQAKRLALTCKQASIAEQSYDRWWTEYGGLQLEKAKHLKELEGENAPLRRLGADLSLEAGAQGCGGRHSSAPSGATLRCVRLRWMTNKCESQDLICRTVSDRVAHGMVPASPCIPAWRPRAWAERAVKPRSRAAVRRRRRG